MTDASALERARPKRHRCETPPGWENATKLNFDGIMTDRPNEAKAFCPTVE